MMKTIQQQTLLEKLEAEKNEKVPYVNTNENKQDPTSSTTPQEASVR